MLNAGCVKYENDNSGVTDRVWDNPTIRAAILGSVIGSVLLVGGIVAVIITKRCFDKRRKNTKNTSANQEQISQTEDEVYYEIPRQVGAEDYEIPVKDKSDMNEIPNKDKSQR